MWRWDVDELWRSLNILHGKYLKEKKSRGNEDALTDYHLQTQALVTQIWEIKWEGELETQRSAWKYLEKLGEPGKKGSTFS